MVRLIFAAESSTTAALRASMPLLSLLSLLIALGGCSRQTCTSLYRRAKTCKLEGISDDFVTRCNQAPDRASAAGGALPRQMKLSLVDLVGRGRREVIACAGRGDCAAFRACLERQGASLQRSGASLLVGWALGAAGASSSAAVNALELCSDYRKLLSAEEIKRCSDLKRSGWRRVRQRADAVIAGRADDFSCRGAQELARAVGRSRECKALCTEVERAEAVRRGLSAGKTNLKNVVTALPQDCLPGSISYLRRTTRPEIRASLRRLMKLCYVRLAPRIFDGALQHGRCYYARGLIKAARAAGAKIGASPEVVAEVLRKCPAPDPDDE